MSIAFFITNFIIYNLVVIFAYLIFFETNFSPVEKIFAFVLYSYVTIFAIGAYIAAKLSVYIEKKFAKYLLTSKDREIIEIISILVKKGDKIEFLPDCDFRVKEKEIK